MLLLQKQHRIGSAATLTTPLNVQSCCTLFITALHSMPSHSSVVFIQSVLLLLLLYSHVLSDGLS